MEIRDARDKEWFWLDNQYLNGYAKILGVYCTVVYLSLCRHADNKTQQCFPSMKLIAEENGMSIKTVERATKTLENWGIIKVLRSKKSDGTQANNIYTLTAKKCWKDKPTDSQSIGDRQTLSPQPTDSDDSSRQTVVLHNNTHINKTQSNNTQVATLPIWLNEKAWNAWIQYRKEKKKSLTPTTIRLQLRFLEEHKQNHVEIIKRSITNGWTGLFPLEGKKNFNKPRETVSEETPISNERMREIHEQKKLLTNNFKMQ